MDSLFINLVIFVLGLIVGSFLNCVIYRLETGGSFLKGRSFCPKCLHLLCFWDLFPVLSFLVLKGKCRYCKKSISWQYPLVELSTALIFLAIFNFQLSIFNYFLAPFLIVIFIYDLKHYLILDKVIYSAIGLTLIYDLYLGFTKPPLILGDFASPIIAAFGAAGFFAAVVLVSRGRWMGLGDVKLAFLMGLILGWPNILAALFFAFFAGAIMGVGLILAKKKSLKSEVPFGPFLAAGTFVALFFGQDIINWYLSFYG